jgi:hypothetical protein
MFWLGSESCLKEEGLRLEDLDGFELCSAHLDIVKKLKNR